MLSNAFSDCFLFILKHVFVKGYDAHFVAEYMCVDIEDVLLWCALAASPVKSSWPRFSSMLRLRSKNWYAVNDKFKGEI